MRKPPASREAASEKRDTALAWFAAKINGTDSVRARIEANGRLELLLVEPKAADVAAWNGDMVMHLQKMRSLITKIRRAANRYPHADDAWWHSVVEPAQGELPRAFARRVDSRHAWQAEGSSYFATVCARIDDANDERARAAVALIAGDKAPSHPAPKVRALAALLDAVDAVAAAWPVSSPRRRRGPTNAAERQRRERIAVQRWLGQFIAEPTDADFALAAIAIGIDEPCPFPAAFQNRIDKWRKRRHRRAPKPKVRSRDTDRH